MFVSWLLVVSQQLAVNSLDNGVGVLPAMGVNTWNSLRCDGISADNIKAYADKMIELGLKDLGYIYVNIDDCWSVGRDAISKKLQPNTDAFPNGVKEVADYVHSKGLKLGIYGDRGTYTCEQRPGSLGYEEIDAQTYADWGIDYLKEDSCFATTVHSEAKKQYAAMRDALNRTGRPILFSLCGWNAWYAKDGQRLGHSWRISADSDDWVHIYVATRTNENLHQFAGKGGFNDPDMLVSSNSEDAIHITKRQARTQFSLWAIMTAPLLIGSNLLHVSDHDLETLMNADVIAINQDKLTIQGKVISSTCGEYTIREQNFFKPWFYPHRKSKFIFGLFVIVAGVFAIIEACLIYFIARTYRTQVRSLDDHVGEPPLIEMQKSHSGDVVVESEVRLAHQTRKHCCRKVFMWIVFVFCGGICSICLTLAIWVGTTFDNVEECQQIWHKPLSANHETDAALLLMNWASTEANISCDESCLKSINFSDGACVHNVWADAKKRKTWRRSIREVVPGNGGSFLFRLTRSKRSCIFR